ncbi:hypothetical protein GCM10009623_17450 [Nocardioides aestuarii]|uniref:DUF1707 domain-containing protein n=1 Tax=Nocardioides aestuarii TaxID=252231 RepID=A0ABW4TN63_9ACTN
MSPEIRIGDAEREQAQTDLGEHYAAGRLDHDEYTQRLDQVWAARTRSELDPVFRDLPGGHQVAWSTAAQRGRPVGPTRRPSARVPLPLLVLLVVLGVVAVVTHLPIVLIGLGVWFFFLRGGGHCRSRT